MKQCVCRLLAIWYGLLCGGMASAPAAPEIWYRVQAGTAQSGYEVRVIEPGQAAPRGWARVDVESLPTVESYFWQHHEFVIRALWAGWPTEVEARGFPPPWRQLPELLRIRERVRELADELATASHPNPRSTRELYFLTRELMAAGWALDLRAVPGYLSLLRPEDDMTRELRPFRQYGSPRQVVATWRQLRAERRWLRQHAPWSAGIARLDAFFRAYPSEASLARDFDLVQKSGLFHLEFDPVEAPDSGKPAVVFADEPLVVWAGESDQSWSGSSEYPGDVFAERFNPPQLAEARAWAVPHVERYRAALEGKHPVRVLLEQINAEVRPEPYRRRAFFSLATIYTTAEGRRRSIESNRVPISAQFWAPFNWGLGLLRFEDTIRREIADAPQRFEVDLGFRAAVARDVDSLPHYLAWKRAELAFHCKVRRGELRIETSADVWIERDFQRRLRQPLDELGRNPEAFSLSKWWGDVSPKAKMLVGTTLFGGGALLLFWRRGDSG